VPWALATWGKELWERWVQDGGGGGGGGVGAATEWERTGSLLVCRTADEAESLRARETLLSDVHGVSARFLDAAEVEVLEPALALGAAGGALLVGQDAQINGRAAASHLLRTCVSPPLPPLRS